MIKKTTALLLAFFLLTACSCAAKKTDGTAEETAAASVSPASAELPSEADTAAADDGTFHLSALPDIGSYSPKRPVYYYGEPLDEFRPSKDYGTLVPYVLNPESHSDYEVERAGFMTADGKIITGPIYSGIDLRTGGGETFYYAQRKLLDPSPERLDHSGLSEMTDAEREAFYRRESAFIDRVEENSEVQLISTDGSRCRTFTGESPSLFTDPVSGMTLIQSGKQSEEWRGLYGTYRIYGTDLNLLADFTYLLEDYPQGLTLIGADETGYALAAEVWDYATGDIDDYVLLFEGTKLMTTAALEHGYPEGVFSDWIVGTRNLYDFSGRPVLSDSVSNVLYAPSEDCCFAADKDGGKLIRIDRDGSRKEIKTPWGSGIYLQMGHSGGKDFLLLQGAGLFSVFDTSLREVFTSPFFSDGSVDFSSSRGYYARDFGDDVALLRHGNTTDIYSLTGELLQEIENETTYCEFFADGYAVLTHEDGSRFLFSRDAREIRELTGGRGCWPRFADGNVVEFYESTEDYEFVYSLVDSRTGETLYDDVGGFKSVRVNGRTFYSFVRNDISYVFDENMRSIAEIYDGCFA